MSMMQCETCPATGKLARLFVSQLPTPDGTSRRAKKLNQWLYMAWAAEHAS